ncbi:MAG: hypothetical protein ACFFAS_06190 [Promethearchaeota archaeon]
MAITVLFSWISKILVITIGLEYSHIPNFDPVDPTEYWLLLRIVDFRVSFIFLTISMYFAYVLKVNLFEDGYDKKIEYLLFHILYLQRYFLS